MKHWNLFSLLLTVMLILAGVATYAQDETGCTIELSAIAATLIQAQDAAGRDDTETALALLGEAEASIAAIRASCRDSVEVDRRTITYTTPNSFTFDYPARWTLEQLDSTSFVIGTSQDVITNFSETNPTFRPGEQAVGLTIGSASEIIGSEDATLTDVIAEYARRLREVGYTLESRDTVTAGNFEGRRLDFSSAGFEGTLIALPIDDDTIALFIGSAAVGQKADLESVLLAIAGSLIPPQVETEDIELTRTYTLDDAFTFDYPGDWVTGNADNLGGTNTIILGSSESVLDSFDNSTPVILPNSVAFAALVTDGEDLVDIFPEDMTFDDFVNSIEDTVLNEFVVEESIFLNYGDYRAAEITFGDRGFSAVMTILELRRGQIFALLFTLMPRGEDEAARTLTRAITASVQFPPDSLPLGEPRIVEE